MVLSASPRRMFAKKSADSQCGSFSPSFRRACQTVFDGQNALIFCFPPRQTKIRRANSEAPLPAGANSVASAHRQRPLPAGQGSVISPPVRSFLPRKSVKGNTSTFPLHILPPEKTAEQRTIGKNKRQTSVFNAGAAIPCSAGARGDARPGGPAARRPRGPEAQRPGGPEARRPRARRPRARRPRARRPRARRPRARRPRARRPSGPEAQRPGGPAARRPSGPEAQRPGGPEARRPRARRPRARRPRARRPRARRPRARRPRARRPRARRPRARRPRGPEAQRPGGPGPGGPGPGGPGPGGPVARRPRARRPRARRPRAQPQWPGGVGSEQTRPSPTSRGLGRFVSFRMRRQGSRRRQAREQEPAACEGGRWATLPCPAGARGRCRRAGSTLFAPAGQKRFRVGAPDFGLSRGKVVCRAVCPSGMIGRRAGEEERSGLRSMKPLRFSRHPAGSTAGSARTRSRDQSLENPFLGNRPFPKKRRRRQAPAPEPAAVCSDYRPNRTETQSARPLLVGRVCVYTEPKALAADTVGLGI